MHEVDPGERRLEDLGDGAARIRRVGFFACSGQKRGARLACRRRSSRGLRSEAGGGGEGSGQLAHAGPPVSLAQEGDAQVKSRCAAWNQSSTTLWAWSGDKVGKTSTRASRQPSKLKQVPSTSKAMGTAVGISVLVEGEAVAVERARRAVSSSSSSPRRRPRPDGDARSLSPAPAPTRAARYALLLAHWRALSTRRTPSRASPPRPRPRPAPPPSRPPTRGSPRHGALQDGRPGQQSSLVRGMGPAGPTAAATWVRSGRPQLARVPPLAPPSIELLRVTVLRHSSRASLCAVPCASATAPAGPSSSPRSLGLQHLELGRTGCALSSTLAHFQHARATVLL